MNNLEYFRELSGIPAKLLSKSMNVTVHTYKAFEKETMDIPDELIVILFRIYDIEKELLFCEKESIDHETVLKICEFKKLSTDEMIRTIANRLFKNQETKLTYRSISILRYDILQKLYGE